MQVGNSRKSYKKTNMLIPWILKRYLVMSVKTLSLANEVLGLPLLFIWQNVIAIVT